MKRRNSSMKKSLVVKEGRIQCRLDGCPKISTIDTVDSLSYAAGFVDAEGSFYMLSSRYVGVSVYNNNPHLLEHVRGLIGGTIHQNHRKELQLKISRDENVSAVCELLAPRLILKKEQAQLLKAACSIGKNMRIPIDDRIRELNRKCKQGEPPSDTVAQKIVTSKDASDWGYLGGWVDGDATIVIQRQKFKNQHYYYPNLHIYSAKPAPLLWLQQRFGGQFESRKRSDNISWISSLSFEDQVYTSKLLEALLPHVVEKKEHILTMLQAIKKPTTDREEEFVKIKELNGRYRGLHKFTKTADGKYVDGKRSEIRPHKTHKGIPFGESRLGVAALDLTGGSNPGDFSDDMPVDSFAV